MRRQQKMPKVQERLAHGPDGTRLPQTHMSSFLWSCQRAAYCIRKLYDGGITTARNFVLRTQWHVPCRCIDKWPLELQGFRSRTWKESDCLCAPEGLGHRGSIVCARRRRGARSNPIRRCSLGHFCARVSQPNLSRGWACTSPRVPHYFF